MIKTRYFLYTIALLGYFIIGSCESFVEVEPPNDRITRTTVFGDDQTALSALKGIYNQLFNTAYAAGGNRSVTFLAGLSGDDFTMTTTSEEMEEFSENEISPSNSFNLDLWAGAYNLIYNTNALLEGIQQSKSLSDPIMAQIEGEAKFVRAFTYFYLTNLYGEIPLILDTNYKNNAIAPRISTQSIYAQVLTDLNDALELLQDSYPNQVRTRPNRHVVMALLARIHLYLEDWQQAEFYSSQILNTIGTYELLDNLDQVFLAGSQEALWQISPEAWGGLLYHTREGNLFVRVSLNNSPIKLSEDFMQVWEPNDKRFRDWVGMYSESSGDYYYPFKYKVQYDAESGAYSEYSMVMRLAEQYLIRAEALVHMGENSKAILDIDAIRSRAGLPQLSDMHTDLSKEELLSAISKEKRVEFFSEWGHRWMDLKRTGMASTVLAASKVLWQNTDVLYPVPEQDRSKNPNLDQNDGY